MAPRKTKKGKKKKKTGSRKKGVFIAFLVIVILVAAAVVYLLTHLDFLVKTAIEKYGSQATQTAVRVKGIHISLKEGSAAIKGLTVANPAGFKTANAFSLGEIGVDIDLKSLKTDEIGLEEIVIRAPEIFVEINQDKQNNLNELKKNLPADGGARSKSSAPKGKSKEKKLFIRRILFTEAQIHALVVPLNNKETQLSMPTLEMRNLRGTPQQITVQILSRLTNQALAEVKKKGIEQAVNKLGDQAKSQIDSQKKKVENNVKKKLGL